MKVMKFGGTSVGKPSRMKEVAALITKDKEEKIVVLSALSGTTNALVQIGENLANGYKHEAVDIIEELKIHYNNFCDELYTKPEFRAKADDILKEHFDFLNIITKISYSQALFKDIVSQGELLSTKLFSNYFAEQNVEHAFLSALDFMTIDANDEPQVGSIKVKLSQQLNKHKDKKIFITQGFICKNARGEVDNLQRGGSDYSASLIAAAINAGICEIWTDIDGMHNNDPRIVENTKPIENLSFDEAAELAYFGAKILHPASVWPAQFYNVPVKLLNTMQPEAKGTLISEKTDGKGVKAVAAKDGITAINISSSRMLMAYGFLRKIFEIFEKYKTPIDLITTSQVDVSLTIDNTQYLTEIIKELEVFGKVNVDNNQSIIVVVGNEIAATENIIGKVAQAVKDFSYRMLSYGGSKHNISLLVPTHQKNETLKNLSAVLFN